MRSYFGLWVAVPMLVLMLVGEGHAVTPSAAVPGATGIKEAMPAVADDIVESYRLRLNSIPYLLGRYMDSGDLLIVQSIYDAMDAVDQNIKKMGESIDSVRNKEIFAKLMAGTQKLKQDVDKNLQAIDHLRRLKRVFDYRSSQLIVWAEDQADEGFLKGLDRPAQEKKALLSALREFRVTLLKAVSQSGPAAAGPVQQPRSDKSRALWNAAAAKADMLVGMASSDTSKVLATALASSVQNLRKMERALVAQAGEVKQGWDETMSVVESLESLMQPASATDKKTVNSAPKETDATKAPEAPKK